MSGRKLEHVSKTNLTETKNKYSAFGVRPNILKPEKRDFIKRLYFPARHPPFCFPQILLCRSPRLLKFQNFQLQFWFVNKSLIFENCIGLRQDCHEFGSHHGFCSAVSALFAFLQIAPFVSISRLLAPSPLLLLVLLVPLLPSGLFCFQHIQHLLTTASATFELRYNNGLSTRCK